MRSPKQKSAVDIAELRDELRRIVQTLALLASATREGESSFTVKDFLARNQLSESQYHKLRRQGRGPRVMSVGSCGVRISRQAESDWVAEREIEAEVVAKEQGDRADRKNSAIQTSDPTTRRMSNFGNESSKE